MQRPHWPSLSSLCEVLFIVEDDALCSIVLRDVLSIQPRPSHFLLMQQYIDDKRGAASSRLHSPASRTNKDHFERLLHQRNSPLLPDSSVFSPKPQVHCAIALDSSLRVSWAAFVGLLKAEVEKVLLAEGASGPGDAFLFLEEKIVVSLSFSKTMAYLAKEDPLRIQLDDEFQRMMHALPGDSMDKNGSEWVASSKNASCDDVPSKTALDLNTVSECEDMAGDVPNSSPVDEDLNIESRKGPGNSFVADSPSSFCTPTLSSSQSPASSTATVHPSPSSSPPVHEFPTFVEGSGQTAQIRSKTQTRASSRLIQKDTRVKTEGIDKTLNFLSVLTDIFPEHELPSPDMSASSKPRAACPSQENRNEEGAVVQFILKMGRPIGRVCIRERPDSQRQAMYTVEGLNFFAWCHHLLAYFSDQSERGAADCYDRDVLRSLAWISLHVPSPAHSCVPEDRILRRSHDLWMAEVSFSLIQHLLSEDSFHPENFENESAPNLSLVSSLNSSRGEPTKMEDLLVRNFFTLHGGLQVEHLCGDMSLLHSIRYLWLSSLLFSSLKQHEAALSALRECEELLEGVECLSVPPLSPIGSSEISRKAISSQSELLRFDQLLSLIHTHFVSGQYHLLVPILRKYLLSPSLSLSEEPALSSKIASLFEHPPASLPLPTRASLFTIHLESEFAAQRQDWESWSLSSCQSILRLLLNAPFFEAGSPILPQRFLFFVSFHSTFHVHVQ